MLVYSGTKKNICLSVQHASNCSVRWLLCENCPVHRDPSLSGHLNIWNHHRYDHHHCEQRFTVSLYHTKKKVYSITVSYQNWFQIKRTCTDSFEVNFFMVNHACMTEVGVKKFFEYFLAFLYCGSLSILIDQICGIIIQRPIFRIPAQIFHNRM